jgi:hypothetical protein
VGTENVGGMIILGEGEAGLVRPNQGREKNMTANYLVVRWTFFTTNVTGCKAPVPSKGPGGYIKL